MHKTRVWGVYWILVGRSHNYLGFIRVLLCINYNYLGINRVLVDINNNNLGINGVVVGGKALILDLFGY